MIRLGYLLCLLVSLGGLATLDRRWHIALWSRTRPAWQAAAAVAAGVLLFLAWDVSGLALGIFATNQAYVSGIHLITPNLPLEEFLFVTLLCYISLLGWLLAERRR